MSLRDENLAAWAGPDDRPVPELSQDRWADWRGAMARVAAILLHLAILGLMLVHWPDAKDVAAFPEIQVEIVMAPPPKPKAEPSPKPAPPAVQAESGGAPNLAAGQPSPQAPKPPRPAPATAAEPDAPARPPVQAAAATPPPPVLPRATIAAEPIPVPKPLQPVEKAPPAFAKSPPMPATPSSPAPMPKPAASLDNPRPQVAALPPTRGPAPSRLESTLHGMDGGDAYLNAMRDDIVGNIIYPSAANGRAGMARYLMTVDRRGYLRELRLVQSSGSTALDRAGLDAIQNTAPFRPLPLRILGDAIRIEAFLHITPHIGP